MSEEIPKKIYRHVLKGLQFYHLVDGSGSSLNELAIFVFLKNKRIFHPDVVQRWVDSVLDSFKTCGILQDTWLGNYQLHDACFNGPFDNEERFVINPNNNQIHHENNSSKESLSTVPYYRRILNRKGIHYTLPKHRMHGNVQIPQHLKNTITERVKRVPLDGKFKTALQGTTVSEISSDED